MAAPAPAQPIERVTVARLLMLAAFVLFVIASLCLGGVISLSGWAFYAGAFAAWALAKAVSGAVP